MTEEWSLLPSCLMGMQRVTKNGIDCSSTSDLVRLSSIPGDLKETPNWVVWKIEPRYNDPKKTPTKVPYQVRNYSQRASSVDEETWSRYEDAVRRLDEDFETTWPQSTRDPERVFPRRFAGLGFVFDGTGICGIDLDGALDREGNLDPAFKSIIDGFEGTYLERSPSGTGLHIILKTEQPFKTGHSNGWKDTTDRQNKKREVAFYFDSRFFTLTGNVFSGSAIIKFSKEHVRKVLAPWIHDPEPSAFVAGPTAITMDDEEVVRHASSAKNKEKFESLFKFAAWESRYSSQSEADAALASLLTFWTQDTEQIQRIMEHSSLAREKWVKRPEYLKRTIQRAVNNTSETYGSKRKRKEDKAREYLKKWGLAES